MRLAYCRDCKTAIAAGDLAPQRTVVLRGKRKVVRTMPYHTVDGEKHENVGLLDIPDRSIPLKGIDKWMKGLTERHKSKFK